MFTFLIYHAIKCYIKDGGTWSNSSKNFPDIDKSMSYTEHTADCTVYWELAMLWWSAEKALIFILHENHETGLSAETSADE